MLVYNANLFVRKCMFHSRGISHLPTSPPQTPVKKVNISPMFCPSMRWESIRKMAVLRLFTWGEILFWSYSNCLKII
jgi:hypothetical protein